MEEEKGKKKQKMEEEGVEKKWVSEGEMVRKNKKERREKKMKMVKTDKIRTIDQLLESLDAPHREHMKSILPTMKELLNGLGEDYYLDKEFMFNHFRVYAPLPKGCHKAVRHEVLRILKARCQLVDKGKHDLLFYVEMYRIIDLYTNCLADWNQVEDEGVYLKKAKEDLGLDVDLELCCNIFDIAQTSPAFILLNLDNLSVAEFVDSLHAALYLAAGEYAGTNQQIARLLSLAGVSHPARHTLRWGHAFDLLEDDEKRYIS